MPAGFFCSSTLRVTVSTSVSESGTRIVNRSMSFCRSGTPVRALWPAATRTTWLSSSLETASATSVNNTERSLESPMYCCASSRMRTVHGNRPSRPAWRSACFATRRKSAVGISVSRFGNCSRIVLRASISFAANFGVARQDTAGDVAADVQVVELGLPHSPGLGNLALHRLEVAVFLKPEDELRLGVLVWKPDASEKDAKHGLPNEIRAPAWQAAGCRGQPSRALAGCVEFSERASQIVRHGRHEASRGRTVRKDRVDPQVSQHLQEVRLAATEEPADPRGLLARVREVLEKRLDDPGDPVCILPFADEGAQFGLELCNRSLIALVGDPRLALIDEGLRGIALKQILNRHAVSPVPCKVIGMAM